MAHSRNTLVTDFTEGPITQQLLRFSAPLFLSNLLQVVYNMADMVIVGQAAGKAGISAVSVAGDLTNLLTFMAIGFSTAGQVIIAQFIGANQKEKVGPFVGTMFSFLTLCAVVISSVCLCLRIPILQAMNTPPQSWDQTVSYATICMTGLVFIYGYNMVSAVLRGMGDSKHPFIFVSIAAVMNIILDLLFVMKFNMGAGGAALATVISQGVSFISCVVFLWRNRHRLGFAFSLSCLYIRKDMLLPLMKLGTPMAIRNASVHFSKLFVNSWINTYGVAVSAMAGIANKISSICILLSNAVNTAGASMVGQNIGAQKYERVPRIMWASFCIVATISTFITVMVLLFPHQVFGIFTHEADVLEIAMEYVPIAILIFFGSACRTPSSALVNGCGNHSVNFAVAILDGLVLRIGLSLLFGLVLDMKYIGFWLGDALAGYTPLWLGMIYYWTGRWKHCSIIDD